MAESLTQEQWVERAAALESKQDALPFEERLAVVFFTVENEQWGMYPYVPSSQGEEETYPFPPNIQGLGLVGWQEVS